MSEETATAATYADYETLSVIGMGALGAVGRNFEEASANRLMMIERRILRIEMLLRRAGIDPEMLELPR